MRMEGGLVRQAARMLAAARRGAAIDGLPATCRPADAAAAYAIQQEVASGIAIGGWKVGAAGPDRPCTCAPLPSRSMVLIA